LGWDAGVEQPLFNGRAMAALTYFHNDFRDLIDFSVIQGYVNIGRAETKGIEVEFSGRPREDFFFSLIYSCLDARDKIEGTPLLRRPRDILCARFSYSFLTRWTAAVAFDYVGQRKDMNYNVWPVLTVTLPAHSLLNGVISYEAGKNAQLFVRLDNILDKRYEMVYGYGTLGFSVQAGVKLDL